MIIISALLYVINFLSLHEPLVYALSVYFLFEEFSEDGVTERHLV